MEIISQIGAIGVGVNVYYHHAWPALALQVIWGIIAIESLGKIYKKKKIIND